MASWLDEKTEVPTIMERAMQLDSFVAAMADGRIDEDEIQRQEQRLVALMKEIEPQLAPGLHAKVTDLLCELTAYNLMQMTRSLHEARPKTKLEL